MVSRGRSRPSRAISRSLPPSPYTPAVSTKLTPESIAACSVRIDSSSSTAPHDPPIAHAPKLTVDKDPPVRPSSRYVIRPLSSARRPRGSGNLRPPDHPTGASKNEANHFRNRRDSLGRRGPAARRHGAAGQGAPHTDHGAVHERGLPARARRREEGRSCRVDFQRQGTAQRLHRRGARLPPG